jgi:hypothetical protein
MKQTVSTAAGDPIRGLDRRQFLVSFIIATAGALGARALPAAAESVDTSPTAADWQSVLETMFPHDNIDRALYGVPAGALVSAAEKDAGTRQLMEAGWRSLRQAAGGDWSSATGEARSRAIATIVGTPLFAVLRQTTVFTFYGNPGVWEAFGYEGDAWSFGGYLGKGLDTVDWLPNPPAPAEGS